ATGRERFSLRGHKGQILSLTFSGDGKRLFSGSEDTTVLVWDLTAKHGAAGPKGQPLTAQELEAAWTDLADAAAAPAYQALRRLEAARQQAVPYLRQRVRPVAVVDEQRLARLIADLDSDTFTVRSRAASELEKLGSAAVPACRKALAGRPSAEVRR